MLHIHTLRQVSLSEMGGGGGGHSLWIFKMWRNILPPQISQVYSLARTALEMKQSYSDIFSLQFLPPEAGAWSRWFLCTDCRKPPDTRGKHIPTPHSYTLTVLRWAPPATSPIPLFPEVHEMDVELSQGSQHREAQGQQSGSALTHYCTTDLQMPKVWLQTPTLAWAKDLGQWSMRL